MTVEAESCARQAPARLTKGRLLIFYQRSRSSCSGQGVRGLPLPLLHKGSGGHNLETLDLDSRLAVGPKVALADDYGWGGAGNSTQFVSTELGHRILKTEETQKPKNSTSQGTVLLQFPGPRVVWTDQERMESCLGRQAWAPRCPGASRRGGGLPAPSQSPKPPAFQGVPCFPTCTKISVWKVQLLLDTLPPLDCLY